MIQEVQSLGNMSLLAQQLNRVTASPNQNFPAQSPDPVTFLAQAAQEPTSPYREIAAASTPGEIQRLKENLGKLEQKVDVQSSEIADIRKSVESAEKSAATCAQEARATRNMMEKMMNKFERTPPQGMTAADTPTNSSTKPLMPVLVTAAEHDSLCAALGVGVRNGTKPKALRDRLGEEGLAFEEWWNDVYKNKTEEQWRKKLKCIGFPEHLYENATQEQIGDLLFQHVDEDCAYSERPLEH